MPRQAREEHMARSLSTTHSQAHAGSWLHWPHWRWPCQVSAVLGVWLAVSAFALEHSFASRVNAFVVGVWIASDALWAVWSRPMRITNTIAALWLGAATLWMSDVEPMTFWNNVAVA